MAPGVAKFSAKSTGTRHQPQLQENTTMYFGEKAGSREVTEDPADKSGSKGQTHDSGFHSEPTAWPIELIAARNPAEGDIDTYRELRLQLLKRWFSLGHKSLAFLGPDYHLGLSFFIANLALVFAQADQATLIVDANLRQPRQHRIFNLPDAFGLSDILSSAEPADCPSHLTAFRHLHVLTAGSIPENPHRVLASDSFERLTKRLSARFEVTLVDLPPFNAGAGALAVAAKIGGALLVTRRNQSRVSDLISIEKKLRDLDVKVVGSVLLDF